MLEIMRTHRIKLKKAPEKRDIIVKKHRYVEEETEKGILRVKKTELVNVTKKVNETKKVINQDIAAQKIAEIERIYTK